MLFEGALVSVEREAKRQTDLLVFCWFPTVRLEAGTWNVDDISRFETNHLFVPLHLFFQKPAGQPRKQMLSRRR